jgi:hypothetical protein
VWLDLARAGDADSLEGLVEGLTESIRVYDHVCEAHGLR